MPLSAHQIGAEEIDGVGDLERGARAGALDQHRRGEAGDAELPAGSSPLPLSTTRFDLNDRHFVQLDDPHRQAVRELPLLNRRQLQRRRRAGLRRVSAVGRLRAERSARDERQRRARALVSGVTHGYFALFRHNGQLDTASFGRNRRAAARTSPGDSAR